MDQATGLLQGRASTDSNLSLSEADLHSSEKHPDTAHQNSRRTLQYRAIGIGLITLFVIFGGGSFLAWALFPSPSPTAVPFVNLGMCGATPAEARDNGCVFDLMMSGWLHPACYDRDLSDTFLRENNWTFYREREAINVIPEEEARLGEYQTIFVKGNFHYQHCAYLWAKQIRAKTRFPLVLDSATRSEEHSGHCVKLVGNPNVTKVELPTGTRLNRSTWKLQCMIGEKRMP